jgi:hypothetical protein
MTNYALIDLHSGFVWGVADAASPEDACRAVDTEVGPTEPREYEVHGPGSSAARDGQAGYLVHRVPVGFEVYDGQDRGEIASVEAHPLEAVVLFQTKWAD